MQHNCSSLLFPLGDRKEVQRESSTWCTATGTIRGRCHLPEHSHGGSLYQGLGDHTTDAPCGEFLCTPYPTSIATNFPHWLPPQITKKQVDNFRGGQLTPCCQLLAKVSGKKKKVPTLKHQVNLEGAKYPNDVFVINLPAEG